MGILDQVIGGVLGSRMGSGSPMGGQAGGQSSMSPLVMALMSLLASQASGRGGSGGGLGGLLGGLTGGSGSTGSVGGSTSGGMGGLGGLMNSFKRSGHGDVMDSWIGKGQNQDISPSQLGEAIGPGTVDDLSRQTGMDRDDLLAELSKVLPGVVDGVTPHGRMPEPHETTNW